MVHQLVVFVTGFAVRAAGEADMNRGGITRLLRRCSRWFSSRRHLLRGRSGRESRRCQWPTLFRIQLPVAGRVRVGLFDLAGHRLPGSIDETQPAGASVVRWNSCSLTPGVYLARLDASGRTAVVRFV